MTLEEAIKRNPFDANRGNESAYCRYLRYNVTGWYNLDSKEVRRRWQKVRMNMLDMDDEKRFCSKCNWNDCDYGCTCPSNEEVYQCPMYMHYHPDEVKEFEKAMEEWANQHKKRGKC